LTPSRASPRHDVMRSEKTAIGRQFTPGRGKVFLPCGDGLGCR
jgi:hypothetical protein